MRSIYIQAKLNKLEHENAVILFKVMDGGSEYCLLECVRPSTGDVEPYTILSFQKFIFGVYVQSIWCVCVCTCTYMSAVLEVRGQLHGVGSLLSPLYGSWGIKLRSSGFYGKSLTR